MVSHSSSYFSAPPPFSSLPSSSESPPSSAASFPTHTFLPRYFPILPHRQTFPPVFMPFQSRMQGSDIMRPFVTPPIHPPAPTSSIPTLPNMEGSAALRHRLNLMISQSKLFTFSQIPPMPRSAYLWKANSNISEDVTPQHLSTSPNIGPSLIRTSYSPYYNPQSYGVIDVRRKNATRESTSTLKAWLFEHLKNPYPSKGEKIMLAIITKMTLTQVSTWFANARRRLKKENKMVWSPTKRTEMTSQDEDHDDDAEDDFEESDVITNDVAGSDDDDDDDDYDIQTQNGDATLYEKNGDHDDGSDDGEGDGEEDGDDGEGDGEEDGDDGEGDGEEDGDDGEGDEDKNRNDGKTAKQKQTQPKHKYKDDQHPNRTANRAAKHLLTYFSGRLISSPLFPFCRFHDNGHLEVHNRRSSDLSANDKDQTIPCNVTSSSSSSSSSSLSLSHSSSSSSLPPTSSSSSSSSDKRNLKPRIWSIDDLITREE